MEAAGIEARSSTPPISSRSSRSDHGGPNVGTLADEIIASEVTVRDINDDCEENLPVGDSGEIHLGTANQAGSSDRPSPRSVVEDARSDPFREGLAGENSDLQCSEISCPVAPENAGSFATERDMQDYNEDRKSPSDSHRVHEGDGVSEATRDGGGGGDGVGCGDSRRPPSSSSRVEAPWSGQGRREEEEDLEALMQELAELNPTRTPRPEGLSLPLVSASVCPSA